MSLPEGDIPDRRFAVSLSAARRTGERGGWDCLVWPLADEGKLDRKAAAQ